MSPENRIPSNPAEQRRELERLQGELASRQSIVHFAHAAVSTLVGLICAGVAGRLWWELQPEWPYAGAAGSAVALGLLVYALVRYVGGKRCLSRELEHFEMLQALRRALGLDDPSTLLPQQ